MSEIVSVQAQNGWNIIYQPLGFIIFFICALAECNRTPFDLPYYDWFKLIKNYFALFSSKSNAEPTGISSKEVTREYLNSSFFFKASITASKAGYFELPSPFIR